ncbi:hypothetical protein CEXT_376491 [Caerostris extrusa]|uniref:Uncharacterized protein n=1 Tax=Caerostris extrusa TaxID=172846 RepID=A0AAV4MGD0_CAEEX|nr:hypothetical protein CEXT_376491 [Caerostris extrusa]
MFVHLVSQMHIGVLFGLHRLVISVVEFVEINFSGSKSLWTLASFVVLKKLPTIFPNISGNIQNINTLSALSLRMKGLTFLSKQLHSPLAGCRNRGTLLEDVCRKHHDAKQMVVCSAPPLLI